jgi:glycerol-3-phosphate dehydrogenase
MTEALHVAVLGAGNWGTVLAHLIASNGHNVRLSRRACGRWGSSAVRCTTPI